MNNPCQIHVENLHGRRASNATQPREARHQSSTRLWRIQVNKTGTGSFLAWLTPSDLERTRYLSHGGTRDSLGCCCSCCCIDLAAAMANHCDVVQVFNEYLDVFFIHVPSVGSSITDIANYRISAKLSLTYTKNTRQHGFRSEV